ncbi:hypothetical protein SF301_4865 [Shigella flexneri 2a str. 301]|uniref:Uncharacterized protein n=1 Tax=Shigella flexneri 2a str. 301 TaxID=198214 RepID=A0AB36P7K7_SHIFL|nr:hypothetical protein SF301_4865 [Shigella flexneri 2a str. 301]
MTSWQVGPVTLPMKNERGDHSNDLKLFYSFEYCCMMQ